MGLIGRPNWVVRASGGGRFEIVLGDHVREVLSSALDEMSELLDDPDAPMLARLQPPAYIDDPDKNAEYQLLAGEELRTSRREAVATSREMLGRSDADESELWAWLQSLNALRLVLGTLLGIEDDDDHEADVEDDDPAAAVWNLYDLSTAVQYELVRALGG